MEPRFPLPGDEKKSKKSEKEKAGLDQLEAEWEFEEKIKEAKRRAAEIMDLEL